MSKSKLDLVTVKKWHQAGDLQEAKQGYLTLLNNNPKDVDALHGLAILHTQQENFSDALECLHKAIHLQPKNPVLYLHLANILKIQGLFDEAIKVLLQIIELDPNCISAYNNLGTVYFSQGQFPEAIRYYRQALAIQADYVDATYNLGLALIKNNELDAAIELYETLLQKVPEHFAARFHLACSLMRKEKLAEAEKHFLMIDETHPYHFETQTNLATCYLRLGALREAKKHYMNALALSPNDTQVLFNLGIINTQLGNMDEAIQHYQLAIQANPDYFEAHNNLGALFIFKQHGGFALHHFKEALRLQPNNKAIAYTVQALSKNQLLLAAPTDYITTLFDAYADHYDAHLLKALDYQVPLLLFDAVKAVTILPDKAWDILDIGCGTGLCAIPFNSAAKTCVGVDLSSNMLAEANKKNIYTELVTSDINSFLETKRNCYDLILAGDVLVYIGELDTLFSNIAHSLRNNGLFAFNTEVSESDNFVMNQSGRFAHNKSYLDKLAEKHTFKIVFYKTAITRLQNNEPVYGHIYVLERPV